MRIVTIDIGSSSIKAGVHHHGKFLPTVRVGFPTRFQDNRAEIDPAILLKALFQAGRKAASEAKGADAIAFCTFSPGVVVMDHQGRPTTPIITHADRRSTATAEHLVRRHGNAFWLRHAGNLPYPGSIGASTLAFLRQNSPAVFPKGYRVGQASTLVGHALTGQFCIDPSQAVFLGLLDIRTGAWSRPLCETARIAPDSLPDVHAADSILGVVSPTAARQLGVPAGIPVIGGFVDTSAAILQTAMHAGQLTHSAGSTDVLAMCLDKPHPAEGILTRPVGVGGNAFAERWLAVRTIASSGSAIAWSRQTFFRDLSDTAWQKLLDATCNACGTNVTPARAAGQNLPPALPICLPGFAGERASIHQPTGASFANLHLSTSREALLQSLVAALARQSAQNYSQLRAIHAPAKTVYAMGGASSLGSAMHRAWARRKPSHTFRSLENDNLAGLVLLATKTLKA